MTTTWIALIRGINVGKAKRVAMADLRALLEGLGYDAVRTHLVSGNALFATDRGSAPSLSKAIATSIESDLGLSVKVLVRSAPDLSAVVRENPFVARGVPIDELYATFLSAAPDESKLASIDLDVVAPDEFAAGDRVIYTRLPNGVTDSKLPSWEKVLGGDATARSWKTVSSLNTLAGG